MKKNILFLVFALLSFIAMAQPQTQTGLNGTFLIYLSQPGDTSDFRVEGTFNSVDGWSANQVQARTGNTPGHIIWDLNGNRYEIMEIELAAGSLIRAEVRDINSAGAPTTAIGALIDENVGYPGYISGLSTILNGKISRHFGILLSQVIRDSIPTTLGITPGSFDEFNLVNGSFDNDISGWTVPNGGWAWTPNSEGQINKSHYYGSESSIYQTISVAPASVEREVYVEFFSGTTLAGFKVIMNGDSVDVSGAGMQDALFTLDANVDTIRLELWAQASIAGASFDNIKVGIRNNFIWETQNAPLVVKPHFKGVVFESENPTTYNSFDIMASFQTPSGASGYQSNKAIYLDYQDQYNSTPTGSIYHGAGINTGNQVTYTIIGPNGNNWFKLNPNLNNVELNANNNRLAISSNGIGLNTDVLSEIGVYTPDFKIGKNINTYYLMPQARPSEDGLPAGDYLPVVSQDGTRAGTNGWISLQPLNGSGAPAIAPRFNGDSYFDYTNSNWYRAFDNENGDGTGDGLDADDWILLN
jgi:hypothetical protein